MENIEIKLGNLNFEVSVEGTVFQEKRVSGTILDEVRIIAAEQFLSRRDLNKKVRDYWAAVRTITPEGKRGFNLQRSA